MAEKLSQISILIFTDLLVGLLTLVNGLFVAGILGLVVFNFMLFLNYLLAPHKQGEATTVADLCGCYLKP